MEEVRPVKKRIGIRLNLTAPLVVVIILMSVLTVVSVSYMEEEAVHRTKAGVSEQFRNYLDEKIRYEAAVLGEYITFIQQKELLSKHFEAMDKAALYGTVRELYGELNRNVEVTHMYFILPDRNVLLRAHDYDRDGDLIERTTFLKARETGNLFSGIEFGLKKNYTLRVVKPWVVEGRLIGYFELGKEIDKIIGEYADLLGTEVYLAVKKEVYDDAPEFVRTQLHRYVATEDYFIVYRTHEVPEEIDAILRGMVDLTDISMRKRDYFVSKMPLSDVSGRDLGYFVFLNDVTLEHSVINGSVKVFAIILSVMSLLLFALGYILLRRKEDEINALTSRLDMQKEELERFNAKLQNIFDLQRNIVILTDGNGIQMANRAMTEFFGFDSLEGFSKYYRCVCERFVQNDNFFHLGCVPEGESWIEAIQELSGEKRIVAMLDKELTTHVFHVTVGEFEAKNYIISFTDISHTMMEQMQLRKKVLHDKLTGVYNREFLEVNIQHILGQVKNAHLGVVICDIDHFKKVNDRYGHNRGDRVLQSFAQTLKGSIRSGDYLIRWGGEEFVILMQVDSADALQKAVEHLRQSVENCELEEVGRVTASFGVTLYREGESIIDTIGRADRALYAAKAAGRNRVSYVED